MKVCTRFCTLPNRRWRDISEVRRAWKSLGLTPWHQISWQFVLDETLKSGTNRQSGFSSARVTKNTCQYLHSECFMSFIWSVFFFSCSRRRARASRQSVCLWWIYTVQLTLWRWCLPTPSGRGTTSLWMLKNRINLEDFRHHLPEMIAHPGFFSPSLLLSLSLSFLHDFPISFSPCIIFCIGSSETATSPWWLGLAAPAWRFVGWIAPRTNRCCACARPPRGHAPRWAVISRSTLVIQTDPAAVHSS